MKVLRYVVATMAFLLVWPIVAVGVGMLIAVIFPPREGQFFLGVWLDWHALPGLVIGFVAGVQVFRRVIRAPKARE
jgi:hypothetical protein